MRVSVYRCFMVILLAAAASPQLPARQKHQKDAAPQDGIVVESHIAVPGGAITRFIATRHYDRSYIYAGRGSGQPVTLLDVTNPRDPRILSQLMSSEMTGNLVAVAGTAAMSSTAPPDPPKAPTQTIRLMDFSNPGNPKITQQFDGVTAVEKLPNGLILLANQDGIWILSQHLADDPKMDERYARKVLYGESMY